MTLDTLRELLLWCSIMNVAILLIWWIAIMVARDMIHRVHGRWFRLSPQQFDEIHYRVMAQYKMGVILFNVVPYIALRIVG
jgi:hypothetical protein